MKLMILFVWSISRYSFLSNVTNYDVIKNVTTIVKKALEDGYDTSDIQVLAPMYQGVAGIDALNDCFTGIYLILKINV